MKNFGMMTAGIVVAGLLAACGGPKSNLSDTKWTSTTNHGMTTDGVTSRTYAVDFDPATTDTPSGSGGTASGPFSAVQTEVFGATAGSRSGCTIVDTWTGGTWSEFYDSATPGTGTIYVTGATCVTTRSGCTDATQNTNVTSDCYSINGGSDSYTIDGDMMTAVGNGLDRYGSLTSTYTKDP
jgi:hypothetical protein